MDTNDRFQILDASEQFEVMATNGYFGFWTQWPILDLRHLWLIGSLDINSRFWILDTSGRFWILDPLVADFRFWTLVANFGISDPRGRFYILDTSG